LLYNQRRFQGKYFKEKIRGTLEIRDKDGNIIGSIEAPVEKQRTYDEQAARRKTYLAELDEQNNLRNMETAAIAALYLGDVEEYPD
jgi:predicted HAD superfamily hydrolase